MRYEVILESDVFSLMEKVSAKLSDGWELQGGVSVSGWHGSWENERKGYTESETNYMFAQAITKLEYHEV